MILSHVDTLFPYNTPDDLTVHLIDGMGWDVSLKPYRGRYIEMRHGWKCGVW